MHRMKPTVRDASRASGRHIRSELFHHVFEVLLQGLEGWTAIGQDCEVTNSGEVAPEATRRPLPAPVGNLILVEAIRQPALQEPFHLSRLPVFDRAWKIHAGSTRHVLDGLHIGHQPGLELLPGHCDHTGNLRVRHCDLLQSRASINSPISIDEHDGQIWPMPIPEAHEKLGQHLFV